ncbi:hypothetical protein H7I53_11050 [Mycolicibacterium pulveris]|uniref:hypothetical protein n=1 Tax=Mycolicibacterium pulveris TaxID=36813 RepID=UPI0021F2DD49|nr:hypothetical protein [Mycolicibacterium pulveris]MCV6980754.1 hypothetical protein [Mycolicibacterium pulveris]
MTRPARRLEELLRGALPDGRDRMSRAILCVLSAPLGVVVPQVFGAFQWPYGEENVGNG